jgi:hypothetical protein
VQNDRVRKRATTVARVEVVADPAWVDVDTGGDAES